MKSGDCLLNVDAIKNQTGPIEKVKPESQASTSHQDTKIDSFGELCEVTSTELLFNLRPQNDEQHGKNQNQTKIQRVPRVLQRNEDFKDYFKPMELSVGPLDCKDYELFKEELKLKLAARFIKDSGHRAESLVLEIMNNMCNLRTSYDEGEIENYLCASSTGLFRRDLDTILANMFFLDGCPILQFISSYIEKSLNEFNINNGQADLIRQDLFLIENEIPFQVLVLLMNMKEGNMKHYLVQFLLANNLMGPVDTMHSGPAKYLFDLINRPEGKPAHLLDLLRTALIMDRRGNRVHNQKNLLEPFCDRLLSCLPCCDRLLSCLPCWLFNVLYTIPSSSQSFFEYYWNQQQSFRNVQELKAAGITMKRNDSCSLGDICFRSGWFFRARVELPPLVVDSSTARKMINLVAYEMYSPDYENNCYVTSYINFLDLLIDAEEDVKDLRSADVLRNRLSSDIEVARLFNRIGSACLAPPTDTYQKVKTEIEKHYKRKLAVWMAQVYHSHFSSPWTILALIGAVAVLLLTAIQTWYTINPKN